MANRHPRPVFPHSFDDGKTWQLIDGETNKRARDEDGGFLDDGGIHGILTASTHAAQINFDRGLHGDEARWASQIYQSQQKRKQESIADASGEAVGVATTDSDGDQAAKQLLSAFTDGVADKRFDVAASVLRDNNRSANEKLTKIDELMPFPPTASAEKLGKLVGVTKQAILKTSWWKGNRKGEQQDEVGRRHAQHRERAKQYDPKRQDDEGK